MRLIPFLVSRGREPAYRRKSATRASILELALRLLMRVRVDRPLGRRALVSRRRYQKGLTSLILAAVRKMIVMLLAEKSNKCGGLVNYPCHRSYKVEIVESTFE